MDSKGEELLEAQDIVVSFSTSMSLFRRKSVNAIDGVSISIKKGESLGLVGESGSGKTTLARVIVKLVRPRSGTVLYRGVDIFSQGRKESKMYRRRVQMIFQDPYESINPRSTAWKAIEEPLEIHNIVEGKPARSHRVSELIGMVGLNEENVSDKYPHQLSGGERQRVSIARALAVNPELLIADEPVSMLDVSIRIGILDLLLGLKRKFDLTYLFITHDLGVARYSCDRIAVMYQGQLMEAAPTEELLKSPMHPYTELLLKSVPGEGAGLAQDEVQRVHEAKLYLGGCKFSPRCPYAKEACIENTPGLVEAAKGHWVACFFPLEARESPAMESFNRKTR